MIMSAAVFNAEVLVRYQNRQLYDDDPTSRSQGSVLSALRANLYLNYDLDGAGLWDEALSQSRAKFTYP